MWWNRARTTLKSVIWADGRVQSYRRSETDAVLILADYAGSDLTIKLRGVEERTVSESLCVYELSAGSVTRHGDRWRLILEDDDGDTLLELTYADADIVQP